MSTEPGSTVWGQDIYQAQGWLYKNQITPPTDPTSPAPPPGAAVRVKYVGRFLDGKVFDQSDDFTFQLGWNKVILGWDKGVATMRPGEKAVLRCSPEMGYGKDGTAGIPGNSTLLFEIEMLEWKDGQSSAGGPDVMGLFIVAMLVLACAAPFLRDFMMSSPEFRHEFDDF
eukprot:TRINITY_DN14734_c0_g3_i2.p1 TRINITY_DN14734_c0_g3~~TRINITY_DN14734_c0_g3_i2.p1  ORF type:complete len:170 (-),score=28.58 TRINITY_DN14734_c0_g3_i2:297-806(-)